MSGRRSNNFQRCVNLQSFLFYLISNTNMFLIMLFSEFWMSFIRPKKSHWEDRVLIPKHSSCLKINKCTNSLRSPFRVKQVNPLNLRGIGKALPPACPNNSSPWWVHGPLMANKWQHLLQKLSDRDVFYLGSCCENLVLGDYICRLRGDDSVRIYRLEMSRPLCLLGVLLALRGCLLEEQFEQGQVGKPDTAKYSHFKLFMRTTNAF